MNCLMFPGQPLAFAGKIPQDEDGAAIAELVAQRAFLDLDTLAWLGKASSEQVQLQLYGVAMGIYRLRKLRREAVVDGLVAEHSMGIYPALIACGVLPEGEALELTFRVGDCLAQLGKVKGYAFACVVGLGEGVLAAMAAANDVYLANYNTSRHFLMAGESSRIERMAAAALAGGAFSASIYPCDAPLHTPLIEELSDQLREIVADYTYKEPVIPLINHLDQRPMAAADIAEFLLRELTLPVYWERTYRALREAGAVTFIEVGAGEALWKYNRWIDSEAGR